jgi:peptidoglycan hydrolase-like protein with peptidoglycan-binding domain
MKFSIGARGENVQKLQKALQAKGFDPGPIDGIFGSKTRMAVISYQMSVGLEPSGVVDL